MNDLQRQCLRDLAPLNTIIREELVPLHVRSADEIFDKALKAFKILHKQYLFVMLDTNKRRKLTESELEVIHVHVRAEALLERYSEYVIRYDRENNLNDPWVRALKRDLEEDRRAREQTRDVPATARKR